MPKSLVRGFKEMYEKVCIINMLIQLYVFQVKKYYDISSMATGLPQSLSKNSIFK